MRKALIFVVTPIIALAAGLWVLRPHADGVAPVTAQPARSVEDIYAPAKLSTARLTSEGTLTLTGTGTPKGRVDLFVDGQPGETSRINNEAGWEMTAKLPPARIRRRVSTLTLMSELPDDTRVASEESLMVLTEPENFKQALLLVRPGAATRVLTSPFDSAVSDNGLTIEAADYDNAGGIIFSGMTDHHGRIRMQAGRTVIGETGPDASGRWTLISGSALPVGTYATRVQRISAQNSVEAQIDLPFTRIAAAAPGVAPAQDSAIEPDTGEDTVPVAAPAPKASAVFEAGNWTLTRPLSGGGVQHTVIYAPQSLPQ